MRKLSSEAQRAKEEVEGRSAFGVRHPVQPHPMAWRSGSLQGFRARLIFALEWLDPLFFAQVKLGNGRVAISLADSHKHSPRPDHRQVTLFNLTRSV